MNEENRARKLEELFRLAADLPRDEREEFFLRHCGEDEMLRDELVSLLRQDDDGTKHFLHSPILSGDWRPREETDRGADESSIAHEVVRGSRTERIGRYRILDKIGEGGMGSVYRAEQEEPVRRQVALKIIKLGMDTRRVVARFKNERQTLAMMDHPSIARIYDGGATDSGRPYFVMEYAPGAPINDYCDDLGLDLRARLELFIRVCEAVHHAHGKGIVHRDLKPSNVLVTERDGRAVPKVIDFGIARATGAADEEERATRASEVIGTCYYMSPEQAEPDVEVDRRSDVYSLGVLLYELLAGVLPFDTDTLKGKSPSEVSSLLQRTDPLAPSTKLSRLGDSTTKLAMTRGVDRRTLIRRLSGDLDWITLKAMERDPERRYASAAMLASDVRRHLDHRTVLAGPPSPRYRVEKFVRRHRQAVAAAGIVLVTLVGGLIGTGVGFVRAAEQRDWALESREAAIAARDEGELRRQEAVDALERVSKEKDRFKLLSSDLAGLLALVDPETPVRHDESVISFLHRAGERIRNDYADDPEAESELRLALGRALHARGQFALAGEHLSRAFDLQTELQAPRSELYGTLWSMWRLQGDATAFDQIELGERAVALGVDMLRDEHPQVAGVLDDLLNNLKSGDFDDLDDLLDLAGAGAAGSLGKAGPLDYVVSDAYEYAGSYLGFHLAAPEGAPFLKRSLELRTEALGELDPEVVRSLDALVTLLNRHGQSAEAALLVHAKLEPFRSAFPRGHWLRSEVESLYGACLSHLGEPKAEGWLVSAHEGLVATRGENSRAAVHGALRLIAHYQRNAQWELAAEHRLACTSPFAHSKVAGDAWLRRAKLAGAQKPLIQALREFQELAHKLSAGEPSAELSERFRAAVEAVIRLRQRDVPDDHPLAAVVARALRAYESVPFELGERLHGLVVREGERVLGPDSPGALAVRPEGSSPDQPAVDWFDPHELEAVADVEAGETADGPENADPEPQLELAPDALEELKEKVAAAMDADVPSVKILFAVSNKALTLDHDDDELYGLAFQASAMALFMEPTDPLVQENLALGLAREGFYVEALLLLDIVRQTQGLDAFGFAVAELAYRSLGMDEEADAALQAALLLWRDGGGG